MFPGGRAGKHILIRDSSERGVLYKQAENVRKNLPRHVDIRDGGGYACINCKITALQAHIRLPETDPAGFISSTVLSRTY